MRKRRHDFKKSLSGVVDLRMRRLPLSTSPMINSLVLTFLRMGSKGPRIQLFYEPKSSILSITSQTNSLSLQLQEQAFLASSIRIHFTTFHTLFWKVPKKFCKELSIQWHFCTLRQKHSFVNGVYQAEPEVPRAPRKPPPPKGSVEEQEMLIEASKLCHSPSVQSSKLECTPPLSKTIQIRQGCN
jgi:hypothetical protein